MKVTIEEQQPDGLNITIENLVVDSHPELVTILEAISRLQNSQFNTAEIIKNHRKGSSKGRKIGRPVVIDEKLGLKIRELAAMGVSSRDIHKVLRKTKRIASSTIAKYLLMHNLGKRRGCV